MLAYLFDAVTDTGFTIAILAATATRARRHCIAVIAACLVAAVLQSGKNGHYPIIADPPRTSKKLCAFLSKFLRCVLSRCPGVAVTGVCTTAVLSAIATGVCERK